MEPVSFIRIFLVPQPPKNYVHQELKAPFLRLPTMTLTARSLLCQIKVSLSNWWPRFQKICPSLSKTPLSVTNQLYPHSKTKIKIGNL